MAPELGRQGAGGPEGGGGGQGAADREDPADAEDVFQCPAGAAEARALALTCDLCQHRMQTVADLLLLTSDPRPVRTASLSVFGESLRVCVEEICDLVVSLTECCAHAGYLLAVLQEGSSPEVPGPVDRYQLCRAAAEVEHKTGLLRTYSLHSVTALQLTDICISVTESANILNDSCLKAADEAQEDNVREQFRLCLKNITATVNTFCGSVKFLKDKPTDLNYRACQVFGEALTTSCNALAVFATQDPQLMGSGAILGYAGRETLNSVLSACMGVVSPCVLVCSVVRELALKTGCSTGSGHVRDDKAVVRVQQCQAAVLRSSVKLAHVLGNGGPQDQR
ncbi:Uncharacterized protein GBIM_04386 [Gryllus bimaculatus]|nr:Uncharacterized protein GBIM_04386 [Gryllus bimaculatus]